MGNVMNQMNLAEKHTDLEVVTQPTSEEEPLSTQAPEDEKVEDEAPDAGQHGYTETVLVKQDEPEEVEQDEVEEDVVDPDAPLNGGDDEPIGAVNVVRDNSPTP